MVAMHQGKPDGGNQLSTPMTNKDVFAIERLKANKNVNKSDIRFLIIAPEYLQSIRFEL